ncbi:hypothetical protein DAEQUDRAFT_724693 [Daedalea quercina L-15889]|uniref:Uncharacterized protein n=1 Tax=Daedalea quercina L-15889 TaxID=1314783 RepID=A0A165RMD1_9APHY|nr:hypothetical protein DAEQUDRAFT_724683 [Daedalea quercina L-15889]KZT70946.1 hypothetical protein DAEQUDRAFT_724693 [Daedalea quercina L-15889]
MSSRYKEAAEMQSSCEQARLECDMGVLGDTLVARCEEARPILWRRRVGEVVRYTCRNAVADGR